MKPQARRIERRWENGRLVYFARAAEEEYWEDLWRSRLSPKVYRDAERGRLRYLGRVYEKYLPRDGLIVEAGCGRAQITLGLTRAGYQIEGVDFAIETLDRVKALFPELALRRADVLNMEVPNGHYAGYISIGVIEHRSEGPEPFLDETFRILRPGGVAVFTVPYINPIRALKAKLGMFHGTPPTLPFYQYAYAQDDVKRMMEGAGFEVLDWQPYAGFQGVTDELPWMRFVIKSIRRIPWIGRRFSAWLDHSRYGHMLAVVVRRPG